MASSLEINNAANLQFLLYGHPLMQVEQTVSQSPATNTPTQATFTTVITDNLSGYNTGTSTYTVPVAGWYELLVSVHWGSNATGARQAVLRQNNVSSSLLISNTTPNSGVVTNNLAGLVKCAVGDLMTIWLDQTSGGALATQVGGGFNSSWSMEWRRF